MTAITKVVHPGGTVDDLGRPRRKKTFTDGEAYTLLPAMLAVLTGGTASGADLGCPDAGKTGTTSNNTDAWVVGITPRLSTAVWVGYPNETTTLGSSVFGGTIAAPIWNEVMSFAKGSYCGDWPPPKEPFQGSSFTGTYAGSYDSSSNDGTSTGFKGVAPGAKLRRRPRLRRPTAPARRRIRTRTRTPTHRSSGPRRRRRRVRARAAARARRRADPAPTR